MKIKCFCSYFEYIISIEILKLVFKTIFMNLHHTYSYNSEGTCKGYHSQTFFFLNIIIIWKFPKDYKGEVTSPEPTAS